MARTARFQMRLPPALLEEIDEARGEIQRSVWVEGAIRMRLADQDAQPPRAPRSEPAPRRQPAALPEPDFDPDPDPPKGEDTQLPLEPETPPWPHRPPPRMTGGRRAR